VTDRGGGCLVIGNDGGGGKDMVRYRAAVLLCEVIRLIGHHKHSQFRTELLTVKGPNYFEKTMAGS